MSGMISLRVIEAQKLKNVTMMHTMDPYFEVVINGTKLHASKPHSSGGTSPRWNEKLNNPVKIRDVMSSRLCIYLFHKDSFGSLRVRGIPQCFVLLYIHVTLRCFRKLAQVISVLLRLRAVISSTLGSRFQQEAKFAFALKLRKCR
jgi:hypothetical protein